jgi:arylsulfatase
LGKDGTCTPSSNGQKVSEGQIEQTQCCVFSADEGVDVGEDLETNVTDDHTEGNNKSELNLH